MGAINLAVQRQMRDIYFRYVEPISYASRTRRRLQSFGIDDPRAVPQASVALAAHGDDGDPLCAAMVAQYRRYLARKCRFVAGDAEPARRAPWRGIALLIDLDAYPALDAYLDRLKRESDGNLRREIEKARQRGYICREIDRERHARDICAIETSKVMRSSGPMILPFLRRRPASGILDIAKDIVSPASCPLHWTADWGVFAPADGDERLVGVLLLKRVGNFLFVRACMGHGGHLRAGIVKLLLVEVMRWLLERRDPRVRGARYLHYGQIETAGDGLGDWRRRCQFTPFILAGNV